MDKNGRIEASLIDLAYAKGLPLVSPNKLYFDNVPRVIHQAHDALLCIAGGRLIARNRA